MAANISLILTLSLIPILFMLLPIALLVALQVWMCKKSVKLGLILPGITLALSLLLTFSMAAFSTLTVGGGNTMAAPIEGGASQVPAQEGEYIEIPAQEGTEKREFHPRALAAAGVVFLVTNIPTAVFGGIWLHYKGRQDTLEDLKRMQIEDLG